MPQNHLVNLRAKNAVEWQSNTHTAIYKYFVQHVVLAVIGIKIKSKKALLKGNGLITVKLNRNSSNDMARVKNVAGKKSLPFSSCTISIEIEKIISSVI